MKLYVHLRVAICRRTDNGELYYPIAESRADEVRIQEEPSFLGWAGGTKLIEVPAKAYQMVPPEIKKSSAYTLETIPSSIATQATRNFKDVPTAEQVAAGDALDWTLLDTICPTDENSRTVDRTTSQLTE